MDAGINSEQMSYMLTAAEVIFIIYNFFKTLDDDFISYLKIYLHKCAMLILGMGLTELYGNILLFYNIYSSRLFSFKVYCLKSILLNF